jgi:NDP-sugar pyrophosphorylase family protein
MHALVLTAGLGTRLRPLSYTRAKAAVPIAGQPLIRRIVAWLASHGVRDIVLNLHHRPETITRELGDGSELGVRIRYSWEVPILGSAGGPRKALPLLDAEQFLIVNGDTLTDMDLAPLWTAHVDSGARVTLAVVTNQWPERYGGVLADETGAVQRFVPRGSPMPSRHFIGVQLVHRSVFEDLPLGEPAESIGSVYPRLIAGHPGSVRVWPSGGRFWDVGTPADYLTTTLAFARLEGSAVLPPGRDARVHSSARLVDTAIWDGVNIEPQVELVRCVVGDNANIPAGTQLKNAAIVPAAGRKPTPGERLMGDLLIADIPHG